MALFVLLTRLTDQGARTIREDPERILEVDGELADVGVRVYHQYATLGRYDFVNIVEAPDNETITRASMELASRGSVRIEMLAAMPIQEFIDAFKP